MNRRTAEDRTARARERAKNIIIGLIMASDGKIEGRLRLYKAFYKAHILYFQATGLELTGYPIVHMPNGPGMDEGEKFLREMQGQGLIREACKILGRFLEYVYTLGPTSVAQLEGEKLESVRGAAQWANSLNAEQLKDQSHNRSWKESSSGDRMLVLMDVLPSERVQEISNELERTSVAYLDWSTGR